MALGQIDVDGVIIAVVETDPTSGLNLPVGSIAMNSLTGSFFVKKTATATDWGTVSTPIGGLTAADISGFNESVQDAVALAFDSTFVYTDASNLISRAALIGDVTATAGSNATTIANDAVTNAKLANMAANTFKANNTGVTGDPLISRWLKPRRCLLSV